MCHGKKGPLSKLSAGDGFIYYSPKIAMDKQEPCKCFTAIGKVKSGKVYQVEMTPDFLPFRVDVEYFPCKDVLISDLFDQLELTKEKSWGMKLRRGLVEISREDFWAISRAVLLV